MMFYLFNTLEFFLSFNLSTMEIKFSLTWLECFVDQAGRSLRVEQVIALTASVILY